MIDTQLENEQTQSQLKLNQFKRTAVLLFLGAGIILGIFFNYRAKRSIHSKEKEVLLQKVNHLKELENTRHQLIQSDKMASLGQLTAVVAHEINDPVNFISSGILGLKKTLFLEKDFEKKAMPVFCFPGQLNQVFMNVLLNAIQAVEGTGIIKVEVKEQAENMVITISDNGYGIPDENKEKIFESFYSTKDMQEGTGLGLSISCSIIKKHKGTIEVKDNDPTGTIFIIKLPKLEGRLIN